MYVTEYRKALRDAGFDGLPGADLPDGRGNQVRPPARSWGSRSTSSSPGRSCARSSRATCINLMGYRMRPYEVEPGSVNEAVERVQGGPRRCAYRQSQARVGGSC